MIKHASFPWLTWLIWKANIFDYFCKLQKIIDYKNSRKPKREEWIQDYFRQTAAYWVAYWDRTGIKADGAEIWIANEIDMMPQCFSLTVEDLENYYKSFIEVRNAYKEKYGE